MLEGREPKPLVYVRPDDDLGQVVRTLSNNKCSLAPILTCDPGGPEVRRAGLGPPRRACTQP